MFNEELEFFIANQNDLVNKYKGKILVIKGKKIVGVYSTHIEAYLSVQKTNELGSVMIQECSPGPDAYTVTIATANLASF